MLLRVLLLFSLALVSLSCVEEKATENSESDPDKYQLLWSDEFNIDGKPDSWNWGFEYGFIRNLELQYYKAENAWCEEGNLIIEAKRDSMPNPIYKPGSSKWQEKRKYIEYTSASLQTKSRHFWKFGRFEMRAKIPVGAGLWPAFWSQGINGDWPHSGEIDIMEYYQGMILANFAWGAEQKGKAVWDSYRKPISELGGEEWAKKYHIWRLDWDSTKISISLDDTLLNSVDLADTFNRDAAGINPFLQPHYLMVNLAVGGNAGGDPSSTSFPVRYCIDYIRIYKKNNN